MKLEDIGLFEINEAFASQALYCINELGIDHKKVNTNGGAIALGHPLGCTGAKLATQAIHEVARRGGRRDRPDERQSRDDAAAGAPEAPGPPSRTPGP